MDAIAYAKELIRFESVSRLTNVPITDYVESVLRRQNFTTERIQYVDANGVAKANVVGRKGKGTGGVAYFGHTDVVPADDWHSDENGPFEPTVRAGRLYGRGSCDMKGSIACMLAASENFSSDDLKAPVYVTCTADEEIGYGGASAVVANSELYQEMLQGDNHGIVGEPTLLQVVYAHKGTVGLRAVSHGRAAHSSTREGVNANLAMIPFLLEMKEIHDLCERDTEWQNDQFNPPTISWNIGINDHTRAINITPPQSICTVYFRPMPEQNPEMLIQRAGRAADKYGIDFEVVCQNAPMYVDPKSAYIRTLLQITDNETPLTVSYGTDGCVLQGWKQIAVLGPGNIDQAHTADEWIDLEQFDKGTNLYSQLIRRWCC